jgi:uncharacterized protein YndB with AHSA1/START domain
MQLHTRAQVTISRPREEVFDFAVAHENLSRVLVKLGPIPGVVRIEPAGGARRLVSLSDGAVVEEEVLELERPRVHRYSLSGLKPPFSLMIRSGEACWTFRDAERGTDVEWVYTFQLRSPLAAPPAAALLLLFRRWMQAGLDRIRAELASS